MELALDALRKTVPNIGNADMQRLSPLGREHINIMGRYSFILPEEIESGGLRPLMSAENGIGIGENF